MRRGIVGQRGSGVARERQRKRTARGAPSSVIVCSSLLGTLPGSTLPRTRVFSPCRACVANVTAVGTPDVVNSPIGPATEVEEVVDPYEFFANRRTKYRVPGCSPTNVAETGLYSSRLPEQRTQYPRLRSSTSPKTARSRIHNANWFRGHGCQFHC